MREPVGFYDGRIKIKKRRVFSGHNKRWSQNLEKEQSSDLIQIDPMSVNRASGYTFKEFKAACPIIKITVAEMYSAANARCARQCLNKLIARLPFEVCSIQVDGAVTN